MVLVCENVLTYSIEYTDICYPPMYQTRNMKVYLVIINIHRGTWGQLITCKYSVAVCAIVSSSYWVPAYITVEPEQERPRPAVISV